MPPLSIMVKPVSGRCNMRCKYCFYADEMARRSVPLRPPMSVELLETLIRKACAYADGVLSLSFQGGEPTLAGVDFFREVVRLEQRYSREELTINNALQTNGYDLSDELINLLAKEHFLVGVSLDGTEATHDALRLDAHGEGTWARVRENLRRMKGRDVEFNILCVVNGEVAKRGTEVIEALAPYEFLQFIPCMDGLDGTETPGTLSAEAYGTFLCDTFPLYQRRFGGKNHISVRTFDNWLSILMGYPPEECAMTGTCQAQYLVESDGAVYPCDFYALDEWTMGNIQSGNFLRFSKSAQALAFRQPAEVPAECAACPWYSLCRNGCRRERIDGKYRLCAAIKAFFTKHDADMEELSHKAEAYYR